MTRSPLLLSLLSALVAGGTLLAPRGLPADGPADNRPDRVRPVPPPGIEVSEADRAELEQGLSELEQRLRALRGRPEAAQHLADVEIYHKAVRYALQYREFFAPADVARGKALLRTGLERARRLEQGQMAWLSTPGPTALGYVSEIDGSVQPYGLWIPESYRPGAPHRFRLDVWFHGRGETLSEVNFIDGVQTSGGPFVRPHTFVLQPYGRYCNANKFAGETDLFEALADVKRRFPIDPNRIVIRGFSMGGAACWQFAGHYASEWAAAAPGAGFAETPEFLRIFQNESVRPTWWERKLWQMYDMPEYAPNFANLPVVAYSGENDRQIQAAQVMARALAREQIPLVHILGPGTGHSYHPEAKALIDRRIDAIAERGRDPLPRRVRLATPTLKYHRQAWVTVEALERHWEPARVDAEIVDERNVRVTTRNVAALTLEMPPGHAPLAVGPAPTVALDGQRLVAAPVLSDRSWTTHFRRRDGRWERVETLEDGTLRKRHNLQGPIDDAFTQSFLIVRPTGTPLAPGVEPWVQAELRHAIVEWRRQFRGDARVKNDMDVTEADIAAHHLVLWGDPGSNRLLARIAERLPIRWTREVLVVRGRRYPTATHVPLLIYPNPLNPRRYVVLNSGFTYREYDYLNNARQVPKLPDWAVVDTTTPPDSRYPGKIVDAGFFGERWEWLDPESGRRDAEARSPAATAPFLSRRRH